jgi:hypothetical protein
MKLASRLCLILMMFAASDLIWAQNVQVSGTVTGAEDGNVVPGVLVVVKGANTNTVTDSKGQYSIAVPSDATLVFSFLGMKTQEIAIAGRSLINVVMEYDAMELDEVVVTALGIKRATKALSYAVQEVRGEEVSAGREMNAITALSGKVAGVDISTTSAGPSGSTRVIIRGNSQLSGSNLPLYVVDGIPMDNTQLGSANNWGGYDFGDGLSSLNSEDIESVSILGISKFV